MIEKIEISKNNGNFFYTGELKEISEDWILINTTRGEVFKFRKEQIQQRQMIRDDKNETKQTNKIRK